MMGIYFGENGQDDPSIPEWKALSEGSPGWIDTKTWPHLRCENMNTGEVRYGPAWGLKEEVWYQTTKFPLREQWIKEHKHERKRKTGPKRTSRKMEGRQPRLHAPVKDEKESQDKK